MKPTYPQHDRRRFLLGMAGIAYPGINTRPVEPPVQNSPVLLPHLDASGYTPTAAFFRQQLRPVAPQAPANWSLHIGGMVEQALTLTYDDLLGMNPVERPCTIACSGSGAHNMLMGHALWRGVSFQTLLDELQPAPQATHVQLTSADGYTTHLTVARLADALIAYGMNGEALPHEHGFPARLIAPGLYGYKMPKWIRRIEFTRTPAPGFWEGRGLSTDGSVQTVSFVVNPRHLQPVSGNVTLAGIAFAGEREIVGVEVSIDDGQWMPVPIRAVPAFSWTPWHIEWQPPAPGDYAVKVRATDSDGFTQEDIPSGRSITDHSSGLHAVILRVVS